MNCTIIVGAGGTGSYFIEDIVNYYNTLKVDRHIIVIDGDRVETKNLLRQGFLKIDLDKSKSEALVNRYKKIARSHVTIEAKDQFVNSVEDVVDIAKGGDYKEITIVSCVDNNMARLRLTFAMYAVRDICKVNVHFVDSGNEEWHGQTITSCLSRGKGTYLEGLYKLASEKGRNGIQKFKLKENDSKNILASIFTTKPDWVNHLTKGDHELSCDDITVSSPQNIGTNMMASKCLLMTVGMISKKEFNGGEYNFNANDNSIIRRYDGEKIEEGYESRLQELLDYVKTEQGFKEVFGDVRDEDSSSKSKKVEIKTKKKLSKKKKDGESVKEDSSVSMDLFEELDKLEVDDEDCGDFDDFLAELEDFDLFE